MSMLLKGNDGNEFELAFSRESLPPTQDGFGDSTWTTVTFRAATADDSWEESAPAVNLFEFAQLAEWLEAVGADGVGAETTNEVELLEPELKFSLARQSREGVTIRVGFHLENRPEEYEVDAPTDAPRIEITLGRPALRAAVRALRADLQSLNETDVREELDGDSESGMMGLPDDDLNIIDSQSRRPPFAGDGEDNAGER